MDWLNAVLLGLLVLGHTTLWITFVNRTHAWPLGCRTLRRIRHVHDVMIPLFPIVLVWQVGLSGPCLLQGGSWSSLNWFWLVTVGICGLGLLWLGRVSLRSVTARPPALQLSNHSQVLDVTRTLGRRPIGNGPYRFLARLPLNEQFKVELNEKTFLLKNWPAEWDGFSILHVSDWHLAGAVDQEFYRCVSRQIRTQPVDLVCFTGDLMDDLSLLPWISETLGQLQGRLGNYFILGNHDWYQPAGEIRELLAGLGWQDVGSLSRVLEYRGRSIAIGGDETPWMGTHPPWPESADVRLLLSHTPDNIAWARAQGVDLMLSGHTHGGQVRLPVIGPVYAPSRYGCKYASGTFWEPPTLLHVSRGLSGIHPFRWRCLPEITRLVLRPARGGDV